MGWPRSGSLRHEPVSRSAGPASGKFLQRQDRLAPIIHSPSLLGIRLNSRRSGLYRCWSKSKAFSTTPLPFRSEGRLDQQVHAVPLAELFYSGTDKFSAFIRDDFAGKPPGRATAPARAGHQIKVPLGGVHLVTPRAFPPSRGRAKHRGQLR